MNGSSCIISNRRMYILNNSFERALLGVNVSIDEASCRWYSANKYFPVKRACASDRLTMTFLSYGDSLTGGSSAAFAAAAAFFSHPLNVFGPTPHEWLRYSIVSLREE